MAIRLCDTDSPAASVDRRVAGPGRRLRSTNSLGIEHVCLGELAEVFADCAQPDWDGYGARPVEFDAFQQTQRFLRLLPLGTPAPSIGATPDGSLSLEWHKARRRSLTVAIDADGVLHYAALLGAGHARGREVLCDAVPATIRQLLTQVAT